MSINENISVETICDLIVEEAQTILMNGEGLNEVVRFEISQFADRVLLMNSLDEIREVLMNRKIRLYEDESDEDGLILRSKEQFTPLFTHVLIESKNNELMIELSYSQVMMDMLS